MDSLFVGLCRYLSIHIKITPVVLLLTLQALGGDLIPFPRAEKERLCVRSLQGSPKSLNDLQEGELYLSGTIVFMRNENFAKAVRATWQFYVEELGFLASGFLVEGRVLVTNAHVSRSVRALLGKGKKVWIQNYLGNKIEVRPDSIIFEGENPENDEFPMDARMLVPDLAVFNIPQFRYEFRSSIDVFYDLPVSNQGPVVSIGSVDGTEKLLVSKGEIRPTQYSDIYLSITSDTPPGFSGGPTLDQNGNLVGVNAFGSKRTWGSNIVRLSVLRETLLNLGLTSAYNESEAPISVPFQTSPLSLVPPPTNGQRVIMEPLPQHVLERLGF